ncbi:nickel pincer cofactor biosynthesis protein LarB [Brevibacillus ginsengisoli]|uniref:nickel pincer cofactor biosynthesis protein LarB n=1 Tax=Brevibacillus ginsengisoli TaxID=363854 RepID=UPI003CEB77D8
MRCWVLLRRRHTVELKTILEQVQAGTISVEQAQRILGSSACLDYAHLDFDRERRTGFPEVIYAEGKSTEQLLGIFRALQMRQTTVLATRVSKEQAEALLQEGIDFTYHEDARVAIWSKEPLQPVRQGYVAIVAAGTSDWQVAQEAAWTVRCMGSEARVIVDVGVAGIHRLFSRLEEIRAAAVIITVAGMEGALASVVAGLVDKPVIAVPTSVGYGANFKGVSALLTMLNSCANGIAVVNIDNGFGAGYMAGLIHRQIESQA